MKEYMKIAWRNIWRNKRRTLITAASIFFAMFLALVMRSFQLGSYGHMINSVVESYTGYIQVQAKDFWEDKTIDNTFVFDKKLLNQIEENENVSMVVPRVESFALASSGNKTKGVLVMGVIPEMEKKMSKLEEHLVKYRLTDEALDKIKQGKPGKELLEKLKENRNRSWSNAGKLAIDLGLNPESDSDLIYQITEYTKFGNSYFANNGNGILLADRLAKFLNLGINDTIVLMGQGFHGVSAGNKFPIQGIVQIPNPELDNMMVYLKLEQAQEFYSAETRITSLAINLHNHNYGQVKKTRHKIMADLDPEVFAVKDWKDLNPELVQQIESDNGGGLIMIAILYMVVAFGIFGTVLMMTAERRKEFGVMVAVGMQKFKLGIIVTYEMILLGLVAIIAGILASIPIIQWYYHNPVRLTGELAVTMENFGMEPVMPMAWRADIFAYQALIVIILVGIAIFYPIYSITRIKVIKALRD